MPVLALLRLHLVAFAGEGVESVLRPLDLGLRLRQLEDEGARIPLIGFFFKSEGYDDENKSLMILIRARITDVRDELKRLEQQR